MTKLAHYGCNKCTFNPHPRLVHPPNVRAAVLALVDEGLNDCEIARRTGIPRSTVRDWRRPSYQRKHPKSACLRCWRPSKPVSFTASDYSELLGLYLGDGCISDGARTSRLRIFLDAKYPDIVEATRALLERSFPRNPIGLVRPKAKRMVIVSLYSSHLHCLFPQAASGMKHERAIRLESWQRKLVGLAPWSLIRGLIRSDGCAFINRTGPYEYLSYDFTNMSKDIVGLFTMACSLVGVQYRVTCWRGKFRVRINRRGSVRLMLAEVGVKS